MLNRPEDNISYLLGSAVDAGPVLKQHRVNACADWAAATTHVVYSTHDILTKCWSNVTDAGPSLGLF